MKELLEAKLISALRIAAKTMTFEYLRENQHEFELAIEAACQDDLKQNGFTLETVSITHLAHP